ncbi:MAG: magnesium transporter [Planctomycetes bacterium]|nr:magnesium transporter [Planctomycetota bacterium]
MRFQLLIPELRELLAEGKQAELVPVLLEMHPSDAAAALSALEVPEIAAILSVLPPDFERDVFGYLDPDVQGNYLQGAGKERVQKVLNSMLSDDRAEFLERLDASVRDRLVPMLSSAAREDLLRRGAFRDDQVGAFLTTDYAVLNAQLTARGAIAELRRQAPRKETIYYSYVVDRSGRLIGFISLRDLILADDARPVSEIMKTDVVSISADADQEQAARVIRDYDLIALPVVDAKGRLVGIVTHDDALDIVEEEAQEDFEKMAGVTGDSEGDDFLTAPVLKQFRRRAPMICLLAAFWLLTASVIKGFESLLHGNVLLIATMPMVMAIGGMVGSQASTLMIRSIATGSPLSFRAMLTKEVKVSLTMALVLSAVAFGNALLLQTGGDAPETLQTTVRIALVIAAAMAADVVFAAALGASIPSLVKLLRIDPALFSTPAVTALTDLTGAAVYLLMVTLLL